MNGNTRTMRHGKGEEAMTWYAVRTVPGSQVPKREFVVEDSPRSRKGYRIVPSLDPRQSAIEKALSDAGIVHYMPAEKRLVRDRRHTDLWKERRFALLVGYVFIKGPVDWLRLHDVPGVLGIVGIGGKPIPIDLLDILTLRSMEAVSEAEFDRKAVMARKAARRKARFDPRLRKLVAKLDAAETMTIPLENGMIAA